MKTQTKPATKPATKASKDTPAKARKAITKPAAKQEQAKPAKAVFTLVAGTIAQIMHKGLRQAVSYHVAKGNLEKTDAGVKLTQQGALLFAKERQETDPAQFQAIAAFIHGGEVPAIWKGQPISANVAGTLRGTALQFPNVYYWGSFATNNMRQAFAALWAKQ